MKKVLITGGAGFIGAHVCKIFLDKGYKPIVFDAFIQYVAPFESHYQSYLNYRFDGFKDKIIFRRGDTRDKNDIRQVILNDKPDIVVHLANLPIADLSFTHTEEAIGSIVNGTVNILDTVKELEAFERFVYVSSSMVYGDFETVPATEDHPKRPKDVYGGTKYAAETLVETYGRRYGLEYAIVRPSAVYGPSDVNRRVSQIFIENAMRGDKLTLHGGGENKLDFTYVEDTAMGIFLVATQEKGKNEVFNITRGEGRSLLEFAEVLKQYFPDLKIEIHPQQTYRPNRGSLSVEKARTLIGYDPKYSLEQGIEKYVEFFTARSNFETY